MTARRKRVRSHQHRLETPHRVATVTIREEPHRTIVKLRFTKYGTFDDLPQLMAWLAPLYARYEGDGIPLFSDNPHSGEVATVYDGAFALITRPRRMH